MAARATDWRPWVFGAVVALFAIALWQIYVLRFAAGDTYPAASSFNPEPVGAAAYYDSLARIDGLTVERNMLPLDRARLTPGDTLMMLGVEPQTQVFALADGDCLSSFVQQGGRLVIALTPFLGRSSYELRMDARERRWRDFIDNLEDTSTSDTQTGDGSSSATQQAVAAGGDRKSPAASPRGGGGVWPMQDDAAPARTFAALLQNWGVRLEYVDLEFRDNEYLPTYAMLTAEARAAGLELPPALTLRGAELLHMAQPEAWQILYEREGRAVLAQRKLGNGTLVIATDNYFVSNEALRADRHVGLLAWLVGPGARVIFDETHLGVQEGIGIMKLARRMGVEGAIVGLLLLGALFVWRATTSLTPPRDDTMSLEHTHGTEAGRDARAGLVNLLRRNLPAVEMLRTCYDQWAHSYATDRPELKRRAEAMRQRLQREQRETPGLRDPVAAYREMTEILHRRDWNDAAPQTTPDSKRH